MNSDANAHLENGANPFSASPLTQCSKLTQMLTLTQTQTLNLVTHSHCAFFSDCGCDLFLLIMGWIGVGDVVAVA